MLTLHIEGEIKIINDRTFVLWVSPHAEDLYVHEWRRPCRERTSVCRTCLMLSETGRRQTWDARTPPPPSTTTSQLLCFPCVSFLCCLATQHHSSTACDWSALLLRCLSHNTLQEGNKRQTGTPFPPSTHRKACRTDYIRKVRRSNCGLMFSSCYTAWAEPVRES